MHGSTKESAAAPAGHVWPLRNGVNADGSRRRVAGRNASRILAAAGDAPSGKSFVVPMPDEERARPRALAAPIILMTGLTFALSSRTVICVVGGGVGMDDVGETVREVVVSGGGFFGDPGWGRGQPVAVEEREVGEPGAGVGVPDADADAAAGPAGTTGAGAVRAPIPRPAAPDATDRDACAPHPDPESELALLTAAGGPLRRALAAICARLLDTQAYEKLCYARLRDYARERAGVSARQLQDLARAHRAFATLPGLERVLIASTLPWSKVRVLTRIATPEDEEAWIARAQKISIRRLEEEVRAARGLVDGALDAEADPPRVRVTLHCTPAVRATWMLAREFAERVSGQRLREDEALEWVTAEALSAVSIDPARIPEPDPTAVSFRCADGACADATRDEPPLDKVVRPPMPDAFAEASASLAPLLAALDEADAFELDRRLRAVLRLEQTLEAAIAPLLRIVTCPHYEWDHAYWALSDFAAEQLGMSPSKARALLRIERAGDACPELRASFREGRLSWAKAQCLLPLVRLDIDGVGAPDWRARWVAWAERVTLRRLEADVERALLLRAGHGTAFERCLEEPARAQDPIPEAEQQMCALDLDVEATERLDWRVPRDVAVLFGAVREAVRGRLRAETGRPVSDSDAFAALLEHALATWTLRDPSRPRPDPVFERDGYRCAVPGCTSRMSLHDHHVVFRSRQGSNELANRLGICAFHHQRCLHAGRLRIRGLAPDRLLFELGVRPGQPPLARYRSGDVLLPGAPVSEREGDRPGGPAGDSVGGREDHRECASASHLGSDLLSGWPGAFVGIAENARSGRSIATQPV